MNVYSILFGFISDSDSKTTLRRLGFFCEENRFLKLNNNHYNVPLRQVIHHNNRSDLTKKGANLNLAL